MNQVIFSQLALMTVGVIQGKLVPEGGRKGHGGNHQWQFGTSKLHQIQSGLEYCKRKNYTMNNLTNEAWIVITQEQRKKYGPLSIRQVSYHQLQYIHISALIYQGGKYGGIS